MEEANRKMTERARELAAANSYSYEAALRFLRLLRGQGWEEREGEMLMLAAGIGTDPDRLVEHLAKLRQAG